MATVESLVPKVAAFLVSNASRRRKTTYGEVARAVGTGPRVVPKTLEAIRALCLQKHWPALTSIVVNASTGQPGDAFLDPWLSRDTTAAAKDNMTRTMQDDVYAFNWAPLLAHYGNPVLTQEQHLLPINVAFQAEHQAGGVHITFGDGFETTLDGTGGSHTELYEHLRRLLIMAGQWPAH